MNNKNPKSNIGPLKYAIKVIDDIIKMYPSSGNFLAPCFLIAVNIRKNQNEIVRLSNLLYKIEFLLVDITNDSIDSQMIFSKHRLSMAFMAILDMDEIEIGLFILHLNELRSQFNKLEIFLAEELKLEKEGHKNTFEIPALINLLNSAMPKQSFMMRGKIDKDKFREAIVKYFKDGEVSFGNDSLNFFYTYNGYSGVGIVLLAEDYLAVSLF